jgi:hypothetical protein
MPVAVLARWRFIVDEFPATVNCSRRLATPEIIT